MNGRRLPGETVLGALARTSEEERSVDANQTMPRGGPGFAPPPRPPARRGRFRRSRTPATVFAVIVLAVSGLYWWYFLRPNSDPRALRGTPPLESMDKVLTEFGLALPSCETEGLRWSGDSEGADRRLLLSFRVEKQCLNAYLRKYGADPGDGTEWSTKDSGSRVDSLPDDRSVPPMSETDLERFGLTSRPGTVWLTWDFQLPGDITLLLTSEARGALEQVYVSTVSNGEF